VTYLDLLRTIRATKPDISRAQELLEWNPSVELASGMIRLWRISGKSERKSDEW